MYGCISKWKILSTSLLIVKLIKGAQKLGLQEAGINETGKFYL